jgi:hypothetical protein
MRILFLRRQHVGELAECIDDWASELRRLELHVDIEDAASWIPNKVQKEEREVSNKLREIAKDYDLVHAFGIRAAWSCAEAFKDEEAWVYTAYDMPRTTHPEVVKRLNMAAKGIASSRAVRNALYGAGVTNMEVLYPGIEPPGLTRSAIALKQQFQLPTEGIIVGAYQPITVESVSESDHGLEALISAWKEVNHPATLAIGNANNLPDGNYHKVQVGRLEDFVSICDLWVVPGEKLGFSRQILSAMNLKKPVLAKASGGLPEIFEEDTSGFLYFDNEYLGQKLNALLEMELTREAVGNAAGIHVQEHFNLRNSAHQLKQIYFSIAEEQI